MAFQLVKSHAPPMNTPAGHQPDFGPVFLAVAHTSHGNIPCKASGNNAWYPYGGKEHSTHDFSYVVVPGHQIVHNAGGVPPRAIAVGHQNDGAGTLWGAIAHSSHGKIPGKAIGNSCWYSYGGAEHQTNQFDWIVAAPFFLNPVAHSHNPSANVPHGFQNDGAGQVHVAIAHTQWGNIPGKAKGNSCWFPYGGKEHQTNNFSWLEVPGHQVVPNSGFVPPNAVAAGNQTDGAGTLWAAIAHTSHGNIPGKAIGNNCWYAYGGAEHQTNSFSWICN